MTYGILIMSFMGAVHWGLAMSQYSSVSDILVKKGEDGKESTEPKLLLKPTDSQQLFRYCLSVIPCLYGLGLTALSPDIAMPALLIGFVAQLAADVHADKRGLVPSWYLKLRIPLTTGVIIFLGISYMLLGTQKQV